MIITQRFNYYCVQHADIYRFRSLATIVHGETIEMHRLALPAVGQSQGNLLIAAIGRRTQHSLSNLGAIGINIHLVVATGLLALGVWSEGKGDFPPPLLLPRGRGRLTQVGLETAAAAHEDFRLAVAVAAPRVPSLREGCPKGGVGILGLPEHRHRHAPFADNQSLPVHRHPTVVVQLEALLVPLHEEVALRDVHPQRHTTQPLAESHLHVSRQLHHLFEQQAVALLFRRPRVVHPQRPCAKAPFAAPLVPDDRPHRPAVGVVDSKTLLCHNCLFFSLPINIIRNVLPVK